MTFTRPRGSSAISSAGAACRRVRHGIAFGDPPFAMPPSRYPRTSSSPTRTSAAHGGFASSDACGATRRMGVSYGTTHAAQVDRLAVRADAERAGDVPRAERS